ncbi:helix-hairpin-helix domain-containing protein [Blautia schinkii]|nr:helix-hairpin-helix domain-containing protein [Blautia schinkii]
MNLLRIQFLKSICLLAAGFLLLCTGLTGCADREAQFLEEESSEEFPVGEDLVEEDSAMGNSAREGSAGADKGSGGSVTTSDKDSGGSVTVIPEQEQTEIYVDVCGAVANPGVYTLNEGSRVFQAIEAAGGFLPEAAQTFVNRAQGLTDGQQVYIPTQEEMESLGTGSENPVLASAQPGSGNNPEGNQQADSGKINLNTADEAALTGLTGIGASKARAIIAYRETNGPFQAIEDIMKVEGIKEGTFAKIKDDIVVG